MLDFLYTNNPFNPKFKLDKRAMKVDLDEDFESYLKLKDILKEKQFRKDISIYYPGYGGDMLGLVTMIDLFARRSKNIRIIVTDIHSGTAIMLPLAKRYFKAFNKRMIVEKRKHILRLYFKDKTIEIIAYNRNAFSFFPEELIKGIDIYYERAFNLFRESELEFQELISRKIRKDGLIVADHPFRIRHHEKKFKVLNVPKNFGFYKKFCIYQKV